MFIKSSREEFFLQFVVHILIQIVSGSSSEVSMKWKFYLERMRDKAPKLG